MELSLLPISNSEDRSGFSCLFVLARVLLPLSSTALASGLVPFSAFLFTRRGQAQQAPPAAQAAHSTRLSGLLPFLPRLNRCGSIASAGAALVRGQKSARSSHA